MPDATLVIHRPESIWVCPGIICFYRIVIDCGQPFIDPCQLTRGKSMMSRL